MTSDSNGIVIDPTKTFERCVVVGAGTMGHGIAQVCALAGIATTLVDLNEEVLLTGMAAIENNLEKGVTRGKVSEADRTAALNRLNGATTGEQAFKSADLFIEAVPENMALKQKIFADADAQMPPGAILASNTSSLSITELAWATKRPQAVLGVHFFNPVHIMKLVELVRGAHTSDDVVSKIEALVVRFGKTSVVVNDAPGFATSRLGITLGNEAMRMVEEGVASPADIDTALKLGYGHPMGPLALTDLVGLDVRLHITQALYAEIGADTFLAPRVLRRLVRAGDVGKKVGRGFYLYEDGKITGVNPVAYRG